MDDPESPRKRGRPPVAAKGSSVATWLSPDVHDRLISAARERDESVSACLRRLVEKNLPKK